MLRLFGFDYSGKSVESTKIGFQVGFEIRDLWVGLFWDKKQTPQMIETHFYVCLIPTIVFHLCLWNWNEDKTTP